MLLLTIERTELSQMLKERRTVETTQCSPIHSLGGSRTNKPLLGNTELSQVVKDEYNGECSQHTPVNSVICTNKKKKMLICNETEDESTATLSTASAVYPITDQIINQLREAGGKLFKSFKFVSSSQMAFSTDPNSVCQMALKLCNLDHSSNPANQLFWFSVKTFVQKGISRRRNTVTRAIQRALCSKYKKTLILS